MDEGSFSAERATRMSLALVTGATAIAGLIGAQQKRLTPGLFLGLLLLPISGAAVNYWLNKQPAQPSTL